MDRVAKICADQPGGVDPKAYSGSYFWQTWETYHDHDPYKTLSNATMANRSLMLGVRRTHSSRLCSILPCLSALPLRTG